MRNFFIDHLRNCCNILGCLYRRPFSSALTITTIGVILSLPAIMSLFGLEFAKVLNIQKAGQVSVFIKQNTPHHAITQLQYNLERESFISGVKSVSTEQALQEMKVLLDDPTILDKINLDSIQAQLILFLQPDIDEESLQQFLLKLEKNTAIDSIKSDLDWINKLRSLYNLGILVIIFFMLMFSGGVVLLIVNTTKLVIENKREQIAITKLMGADNSFIRREFLYYGFWYGFLGACVSAIVLTFSQYLIKVTLQRLIGPNDIVLHSFIMPACGIILLVGVMLGVSASWWSVHSCIKENNME